MAVYKCSIDLGIYEVELEAKDREDAIDRFMEMMVEDLAQQDNEVEVTLADCQYTDQQELEDRENEHDKRGG